MILVFTGFCLYFLSLTSVTQNCRLPCYQADFSKTVLVCNLLALFYIHRSDRRIPQVPNEDILSPVQDATGDPARQGCPALLHSLHGVSARRAVHPLLAGRQQFSSLHHHPHAHSLSAVRGQQCFDEAPHGDEERRRR